MTKFELKIKETEENFRARRELEQAKQIAKRTKLHKKIQEQRKRERKAARKNKEFRKIVKSQKEFNKLRFKECLHCKKTKHTLYFPKYPYSQDQRQICNTCYAALLLEIKSK